MYFKPREDITNQEIALINGFFNMAIADNIDAVFTALKNNEDGYRSFIKKDASKISKVGTLWLSDNICELMPLNVKRHFSSM